MTDTDNDLEYIDLPPTWEGLIPVLVHLDQNGTTPESRQTAREQLLRVARIADDIHQYRKVVTDDSTTGEIKCPCCGGDETSNRGYTTNMETAP